MVETLQDGGPEPLILTVPGLGNSGSDHWQSIWEQRFADCRRVELGMWTRPHRNTWVNKLNLAIRRADRPVVLVAHSLGCLAVAWWAKLERPAHGYPVIGALLVAPPEVDYFPLDHRLTSFAPTPAALLPFPSILVASHNDPYISFRTARRLARTWGSRFADAGQVGHVNAESNLGDWPFGQFLLRQLLSGRGAPGQGEALGENHPDAPKAEPSRLRPSGDTGGVAGGAADGASRFVHGREAPFANSVTPENGLIQLNVRTPLNTIGPACRQDGIASGGTPDGYGPSISIK